MPQKNTTPPPQKREHIPTRILGPILRRLMLSDISELVQGDCEATKVCQKRISLRQGLGILHHSHNDCGPYLGRGLSNKLLCLYRFRHQHALAWTFAGREAKVSHAEEALPTQQPMVRASASAEDVAREKTWHLRSIP